ncbi:MAG TPA: hypothetical protein VGC10_05130 [Sphingomonas sp.]
MNADPSDIAAAADPARDGQGRWQPRPGIGRPALFDLSVLDIETRATAR